MSEKSSLFREDLVSPGGVGRLSLSSISMSSGDDPMREVIGDGGRCSLCESGAAPAGRGGGGRGGATDGGIGGGGLAKWEGGKPDVEKKNK